MRVKGVIYNMRKGLVKNLLIGSIPIIILVGALLFIFLREPKRPPFGEDLPIQIHYKAEDGGTIEGSNNQIIDKGKDGKEVKAVPEIGYYFTGWSDGVTTPVRKEMNVQEEQTITAKFALISDGVTATYKANELGWVNSKESVEYEVQRGTEGWIVSARPKHDKIVFVKWSDGVTTPERQDKDIMESFEVTAIFGYPISYQAGEHGRVVGETEQVVTMHSGSTTEVTAVPDKGYTFIGWSDGVTKATRQDRLVEGKKVTAYFEWVEDYDFTYHDNYATANCTEASVKLKRGENSGITINVPIREHFHFRGWYFDKEYQEQATDEYGKIIVEEVYNQPSRDLYAKWEPVEEDIVTYKILMVYVTAIDAVLKGNDGTNVQLHYRMSIEERKNCEEITRQFSQEINDLLDGIVRFEVDNYFTSRPVTEENIVITHSGVIDGVEKFDYAIWAGNIYYGDLPELKESSILEQYRSVLTTFSLNNDQRLMSFTSGGLSQRKYATIWYDKLLENGNKMDDWQGNDRISTYIHEFMHTVEGNFTAFKFDKIYDKTIYELGLYESVKRYALNQCPIKKSGSIEYVGIPYSAWSEDFCTVTVKNESINGISSGEYMGHISFYNLSDRDNWMANYDLNGGQLVPKGSRTTFFTAKAYDGYRFVGWSDGCKDEVHSAIMNVQEDITLIAYFERLSYTVEYRAEEGGRIEGTLIQTALTGEKYQEVIAIPEEGYRFVGWSDGRTKPYRIDEAGDHYHDVETGEWTFREDFVVYAIFEKIEEDSEK